MAQHTLEAGMEFDGFRLEERLHKGGMATLWRVSREGFMKPGAKPMVMKVPRLRDTDDPTAIVAFEVEQMIMPALTGPHVPRYYSSGDYTEQPYIVMEMIHGESLRPRFEQSPLPIDEVASIGARVATAVQDLHRQHVVHLDLKPSNIMFRPSGEAVLIDFGLSRHDKLPDLLAEEFRLPMGTGPYISPEQVQYVRSDPRSDQFALGALLYHLTTGERAFGNPSSVSGLRKRLWQDPVPPRALRPDCPLWLQEIILRCLEVSAKDRYPTAALLAFDLHNPDQVKLTARAQKMESDPWMTVMKRRLKVNSDADAQENVATQLSAAPIIMAAVDLSQEWEALADALRATVLRFLQTDSEARLACVTVLKTARIGMEHHLDEEGQNIHVKKLVELKHWARPMNLPEGRVTFHVLESSDPPTALIEYATHNQVDHILMGSRGRQGLRRMLGSVSADVVTQAPCTVTVVKLSGAHADGGDQNDE